MSENEFVLTLLVMIFGAAVVILGLLIWNQDKQINRLEEIVEMLSGDSKNKADESGDPNGSSGNDIS